MLTFPLPLFSFLLLLFSTTITTAQPYKPTDYFLLNCGGETVTSDRKWDTDERSKFVPSTASLTSFTSTPTNPDPSVPRIPYYTARIFNTSSFTYTFPVTNGPKFLRLYLYPATYSHYTANQSFFSVSSNGYTLLSNFSAFLAASFLGTTLKSSPQIPHLIKEFIIWIQDTQSLNVTFTPSPNSYAFINGIEIVSLPDNLYHNSKSIKSVGQRTGPTITEDTGLENVYRLNMGGGYISPTADTGMYRSWNQDDPYLFSAKGKTPNYKSPVVYTEATPNYTAPELVYATQRSMGKLSELYNLTWIFPVDTGFWYSLRLHFSNIITLYTRQKAVVFTIFINNQTAEEYADVFRWGGGSGIAVVKDYVLFINNGDGSGTKQDLWLTMGPNPDAAKEYADAFLNGLEVFKISTGGSLAGQNPELSPTPPPPPPPPRKQNKNTPPYAAIIGGSGGALLLFSALGFIVFQRKRLKHGGATDEQKSKDSGLPSDRCRRFSLQEMKDATEEFDEKFVIGKGGFGMVYKGCIDNKVEVAIKRLNALSKQGFNEFQTEIGLLSKLRHKQLVSLIGYCDDEGEMVLVYAYMSHGTLQDHLYKMKNPPLPWKRRLEICIGAAKGLEYLHTGTDRMIIHRDVKSTNILLDENWVAKVADFGLSKLGPKEKGVDHVSTAVKGTIGYMDPEYYRMQQLTDKSDVYSFGVVLLEVLCARPVIKQSLPDEEMNLAEWGRTNYLKGTLNEIVDEKISGEIAANCLMKFGEVACSCIRDKGSKRPKMDEVVSGLELALQFQETAEKIGGVLGEVTGGVSGNQEYLLPIQGETTISYQEGSTGAGIRHGTSSTESESFFTETSIVSKGTSSESHM